jgi:hypothetical protein
MTNLEYSKESLRMDGMEDLLDSNWLVEKPKARERCR